jgi:hypothetical protein
LSGSVLMRDSLGFRGFDLYLSCLSWSSP